MTQTWWLSFSDPKRPKGQQFLGVAVVDVTEADAAEAEAYVTMRRAMNGLPPHPDPDVNWMAAAHRKSHARGCNPGGELQAIRLDDKGPVPDVPRDTLMREAELRERGLIAEAT